VLTYVSQGGASTYTLCIGVTNRSTSAITPAINLFTPNVVQVPTTFAPGFTPCAYALLAIYPNCDPADAAFVQGTIMGCVGLSGRMTWILGQTDFPLVIDYSPTSGFPGVPVIPGKLLSGSGPPSSSQAEPGNLYLDTQSNTLYGPATTSSKGRSRGGAAPA
jgi:hypothetical protein